MHARAPFRIVVRVVPSRPQARRVVDLGGLATRRCRFRGRWRAIKIAFYIIAHPAELRSPVMTSRGDRGI
jgi:hypothetical protein